MSQSLETISPQKAGEWNNKTIAKYAKPYYAEYYLGLEVPNHQFDWYVNIGKYLREIRLSPRDHGKTTVIPRVITEHDTLYNPGDNVLLLSKTFNQANKTLDMIEADLTKNPRIQHDFEEELEGFRRKGKSAFL